MRRVLQVGERFERHLSLDAGSISAFARASGDENPLHHDADFAAGTRFGRIVASGPQLAALLMGLCATRISERSPMLGLDFRFRFRRAVKADEALTLWWQVVAQREAPKLGGVLAFLAGKVAAAEDAVKAVGKVLLVDRL